MVQGYRPSSQRNTGGSLRRTTRTRTSQVRQQGTRRTSASARPSLRNSSSMVAGRSAGTSVRNARTHSDFQRSTQRSSRGQGVRTGTTVRREGSTQRYRSVRVGDVLQDNSRKSSGIPFASLLVKILIVLALLGGAYLALYLSNLFAITNVSVTGVTHMTATTVTDLAAVPASSTLLRVDTDGIQSRLLQNPWVKSVNIKRIFPSTLELAITEREIISVVEVPSSEGTTHQWAMSSDGVWLMDIPAQDSPAAANVGSQVYVDAESALKITNAPYGVNPQVGALCTDESILNALEIVSGMTTSLKDQVASINVSGLDNTVITLDSGVQIAFGDSQDIRTKERICLELLEQNPGKISYINVRTPDRPTWRSVA